MNIEEARKVLWLKSNPRPLGELLDEVYLTKERLEWAAPWAYNSKLRQAAKRTNPQADTSKWEEEIGQLVYQLYGLTDEEIKIVEAK